MRRPIVYVDHVSELPLEAQYILVQPEDEQAAEQSQRWLPRRLRPVLRLKDYRGHRVILLQVGG